LINVTPLSSILFATCLVYWFTHVAWSDFNWLASIESGDTLDDYAPHALSSTLLLASSRIFQHTTIHHQELHVCEPLRILFGSDIRLAKTRAVCCWDTNFAEWNISFIAISRLTPAANRRGSRLSTSILSTLLPLFHRHTSLTSTIPHVR